MNKISAKTENINDQKIFVSVGKSENKTELIFEYPDSVKKKIVFQGEGNLLQKEPTMS